MVRMRSIGVLSAAKIFAVVQAAVGILVGFFFLLFGVIGTAIVPGQQKLGMIGIIVIAVLMPVVYAVLGFVMGAIWAFVYNLVADAIGGLELEFETAAAPAFPAPPQSARA
jgi:hypothetical protein